MCGGVGLLGLDFLVKGGLDPRKNPACRIGGTMPGRTMTGTGTRRRGAALSLRILKEDWGAQQNHWANQDCHPFDDICVRDLMRPNEIVCGRTVNAQA